MAMIGRTVIAMAVALSETDGLATQCDRACSNNARDYDDRNDAGHSYHEKIAVPKASTVTRALDAGALSDGQGDPIHMNKVWSWIIVNKGTVALRFRTAAGIMVSNADGDYLSLPVGGVLAGSYPIDPNAPATSPLIFINPDEATDGNVDLIIIGASSV